MLFNRGNYLEAVGKEIPVSPVDLLEFPLTGYEKFKNTTIIEDVKYLEERLQNAYKGINCTVEITNITVGDEEGTYNELEVRRGGTRYYPVYANLTVDGITSPKVMVFRIPYMNKQGVLNVDNAERVCLNDLIIAQDITAERGKLQVMGANNRPFDLHTQGTTVYYQNSYKGKIDVANFIVATVARLGLVDEFDTQGGYNYLRERFSNKLIVETLNKGSWVYRSTAAALETRRKVVPESLYSINVSKCRQSLNELLSLNKTAGKILAKSVTGSDGQLIATEGSVITEHILRKFEENGIFSIFVKYKPNIAGYYTKEDLSFPKIPKGTRVNSFLSEYEDSLVGKGYVPEEIDMPIFINKGTKLTVEMLDYLYELGVTEILASSSKSAMPTDKIKFYHEVISNHCVPIKYSGVVRDNTLPTDYVYVPSKGMDPFPEFLTDHDILSLLNFACGLREMPEMFKVLQRDADFVKEVHTVGDTFSSCFRRAIDEYTRYRRDTFSRAVKKCDMSAQEEMNYLMSMFKKKLNDTSLLRPADYTNPVATLQLPLRIVSRVKSKHTTTADQRNIQPGHYGNIDPFDTPVSGSIGLVNSTTMRTRIEDNQMLAPYRRIVKRGEKYFVDSEITYLSARNKRRCNISGIMNMEWEDGTGPLLSRPLKMISVVAEVPVLNSLKESSTFEMIDISELHYVDAYPDQTLGLSSSLIPFIGANDAARIVFGTSMFRQALGTLYSQPPTVVTSRFREIVDQAGYVIRAPKSGTVTNMRNMTMEVFYDDGTSEVLNLAGLHLHQNSVTVMEPKFFVNETFVKGDILADTLVSKNGELSVGMDGFIAYMPWYGFNYEDGVVMSDEFSSKFISVSVNNIVQTYNVSKGDVKGYPCGLGQYVRPGDRVITVKRNLSDGDNSDDVIKASLGTAGILYSFTKERNLQDDTVVFTAKLVSLNSTRTGDKFAGMHGNKGVDTLIVKNSEMAYALNGQRMDVALNPTGVGGRMNIGQLLEGTAGFVCHLLGTRLLTSSYNGLPTEELEELLNFVYDVAHCPTIDEAFSKYPNMPSFIKELASKNYSYIKEWEGCFFRDGSAYLINPKTGKPYGNRVMIAYGHILKLIHQVEHKRAERGGIKKVPYQKIYKAPTKGGSSGGGQRVGEMEVWAFEGYGASNNIEEILNFKSDNVDARAYLESLVSGIPVPEGDAAGAKVEFDLDNSRPMSLNIFYNHMQTLGVDMQLPYGEDPTVSNISKRANEIEASNLTKQEKRIEEQIVKEVSSALSRLKTPSKISTNPLE